MKRKMVILGDLDIGSRPSFSNQSWHRRISYVIIYLNRGGNQVICLGGHYEKENSWVASFTAGLNSTISHVGGTH